MFTCLYIHDYIVTVHVLHCNLYVLAVEYFYLHPTTFINMIAAYPMGLINIWVCGAISDSGHSEIRITSLRTTQLEIPKHFLPIDPIHVGPPRGQSLCKL